MLQFDDFYAVVNSFHGNGGLPWQMHIVRETNRVRFVANSNPEVHITISSAASGRVLVETSCPKNALTEPSAQIIGDRSDYQVSSIREIWQLVRTFFGPPRSNTKFSWNDRVRIRDHAPAEMGPGEWGHVVEISPGNDPFSDPVVYTIEYENSNVRPNMDVPESLLS